MKSPLVSIIITSFNRGGLIAAAIDSALMQDYPHLEIIISDNCSTDNTDEIMENYLPDSRVKYFKNDTNIGMIPNFKAATIRATGDYITYISSDDYLMNKHFISDAIKLINKYQNVLLVFSINQILVSDKKQIIDNHTGYLFTEEFKSGTSVFLRFATSKALGWGGTMINRTKLLELNIFNKTTSSLDYEANLCLMLQGNVGFINQPTYVYRLHTNQASQDHLKNTASFINNQSYIDQPYNFALENKVIPQEDLEKWKNDLILMEVISVSLKFSATNKHEYNNLMNYLKDNHSNVYKRLKRNLKWRFLSLFYKNPRLGLLVFKFISKGNYDNLKNILSGKDA